MSEEFVITGRPPLKGYDTTINKDSISQIAGEYALQLDDVTTTGVTYVGKAAIGSSASGAVWQIKKINETGSPIDLVITWADGNSNYDNIWNDRASLTYS